MRRASAADIGEGDSLALEGSFLVERGRNAGLAFEALYCVPSREAWARELGIPGLEPTVLPESAIAELAGYPFHRGVLGLARRPPALPFPDLAGALAEEAGDATVLALPEAIDPANVGSAFRSSAALGCRALLLGPAGPDPLGRRALRASMGATLTLPWARMPGPAALETMSEAGFELLACALEPGAIDLRGFERPRRLVLVLGNEAFGLSPAWRRACRRTLTLPMLGGTDSLNLAAAAAVFLYALGRS